MSESLSRVEKLFIFNFLKNNKVNIELKSGHRATIGKIKDFNNTEILLDIEDIDDSYREYKFPVQIYFYFQDSYHVFNSYIIKLQGKSVLIKNPDTVSKNLKRQYERYLIENKYSAEIQLDGEILPLDYPVCDGFYYTENPPVSADFTDIKIQDILAKFKQKMETIVSNNKIIMLRNFKTSSFIEEIVLKTGRILYIPNSQSDLTMKNEHIEYGVLTKMDWIKYEKEKKQTSDNHMNKAISDYLTEIKNKGFMSEAIVPVLYKNYVVALIYLVNDFKKAKPIELNVLKYASQFAQILSYSLRISGYFKMEIGERISYDAPMYDISLGGFSIVSQDTFLESKLRLDSNIPISLKFEDRIITLTGKLVRKNEKLLERSYGFMFLDIKSDDYKYIENKFASN